MGSTSRFTCIMTRISKFKIFLIIQIFILKFFYENITNFCIFISFLLLFCHNFVFSSLNLIIFIAYTLSTLHVKHSQNVFIKIFLDEYIVDIQKPDGICTLTFAADDFSGLFLHPSIFSIIYSRSA